MCSWRGGKGTPSRSCNDASRNRLHKGKGAMIVHPYYRAAPLAFRPCLVVSVRINNRRQSSFLIHLDTKGICNGAPGYWDRQASWTGRSRVGIRLTVSIHPHSHYYQHPTSVFMLCGHLCLAHLTVAADTHLCMCAYSVTVLCWHSQALLEIKSVSTKNPMAGLLGEVFYNCSCQWF